MASETTTVPSAEKTPVVSAQLEKQIKNKKKRRNSRRTNTKRGVLFLKNLPNKFHEDKIKSYFKQFGRVTRVRLARSKRTGNNRGFAYVEFEYPEVAQEALKSVKNRLMFNKIVKACYIPPEEQKFDFFKTGLKATRNEFGKLRYVSGVSRRHLELVRAVNSWVPENYMSRIGRKNQAVEAIKEAFTAFGLDPNLVPDNPKTMRRADLGGSFDAIIEKKNKFIKERNEERKRQRVAKRKASLSEEFRDFDGSTSPEAGNLLLIKKRELTPDMQLNTFETESTEKQKIKKTKSKKNELEKEIGLIKSIKKESKFSSTEEPETKKLKASVAPKKGEKKKKAKKLDMSLKDILNSSLDSNDSDTEFIPGTIVEQEDAMMRHKSSTNKNCNSSPKNYVKILKSNKMEKCKNILKRNPHSGAIQKPGKKLNKNKVTASKRELEIATAKQMVKGGIKSQIKKKTKGSKRN